MASALDALLQLLSSTGEGSVEEQMRPRQTAQRTDFWDLLRGQYGASPPDQITGPRQQMFGQAFLGQGDRAIWGKPPLQRYESESATLGRFSPLEYPKVPEGWDYTKPQDFSWSDAPPTHYYFPDSRPHPSPQPRDPWAMLRTAPLNQMFARRIPGLY